MYDLGVDDDNCDANTYLRMCFPNIGGADLATVHVALAMVKEGQCVRLPWDAMPPQADPDGPVSIVREVPISWGTQDGINFFHASHPYFLPSIRKKDLRCSKKGVGAGCDPRFRLLYAFKNRRAAYASYLMPAILPLSFPNNERGGIEKHFQLFIGIGGLGRWPYAQKFQRSPNWRSQFAFRPGTFKPMWIELIPVVIKDRAGEIPIPSFTPSERSGRAGLDGTTVRRWKNKEKRALDILIFDINEDYSVKAHENPAAEKVPNWYKGGPEAQRQLALSQRPQPRPSSSHLPREPSGRSADRARSVTPPWRRDRARPSWDQPVDRNRSNWNWNRGWEEDDRSRSDRDQARSNRSAHPSSSSASSWQNWSGWQGR